MSDLNSIHGYKISDSHFKLGSKTHIKDFIYAKRLFQNSFFAHRFAFIVAKYLKHYFEKNPMSEYSLTLLGYGEYSQMLINRVERILQPFIPNINHDLVSDVEEPSLIKGVPLNKNIVIIVPISTTFSTSIKIENLINKIIKDTNLDCNIIEPHLNLILVSHQNINTQLDSIELNNYLNSKKTKEIDDVYYPYIVFNWTEFDYKNKIVTVKTNPTDNRYIRQKFFMSIPSRWYLMDACKLCIPDNILNETPLLETDKASVTPDLLLELPKTFNYSSKYSLPAISLNENGIYSGHISHNGNHYAHYIDPVAFFQENEKPIVEWAKNIKSDLLAWPELFQSKVLLIAPSHNNNTYFVELVNRYIFDDSATIIHYEAQDAFIENYSKFFGDVVSSSDHIFFIDDFIQTGKTFHAVNDFVKLSNLIDDRKNGPSGCCGIFTMVNKADIYSYKDMLAHLNTEQPTDIEVPQIDRFIAFLDLKLNTISVDNCPLCNERNKYGKIAENSIIDAVRHYFLNKQKKLNNTKINILKGHRTGWTKHNPLINENNLLPWATDAPIRKSDIEKWNDYKAKLIPGKPYLKLLIQHELNHILSTDNDLREKFSENISDITKEENYHANKLLLDEILVKILNSDTFNAITARISKSSKQLLNQVCKEILLKSLTLPPFVHIKPIRQKIFSFILIDLEETVKTIKNKEGLSFADFRYFKFLLRRATLLGSNYLIRYETLNNLRIIYTKYTDDIKLKVESNRESQKEYLVSNIKKEEQLISHLSENLGLIGNDINNTNLQISGSIESTFPFEIAEKLKYLQEQKSKLVTDINETHTKIAYINQALNNIYYKEATLDEFNYYYISLVKELTLNNDSKVTILETNLNKISADIDKTTEADFYFLLRLIQFENVSLIHQGLRLIVSEYLSKVKDVDNPNNLLISFNRKCSEQVVETAIKKSLKLAMNDYRLISFKNFLKIDDFDRWSKTDECMIYVHVLYLMTALQNDEPKSGDIPLEDKTKAIVRNLSKIVSYPTFAEDIFRTEKKSGKRYRVYVQDSNKIGGFLAVRYKGDKKSEIIKPEEIIIAQETKDTNKFSSSSLKDVEIDNQSLSYFILNGISNRIYPNEVVQKYLKGGILEEYPIKPWTIFEIKLLHEGQFTSWESIRGPVSPINYKLNDEFEKMCDPQFSDGRILRYGFTENLHIDGNSCKQMIFFRIASLSEDDGDIKNVGRTLICIYNDADDFDIKRIRLLLLMRDYIYSFMQFHFDNDSIVAFINERIKLKDADRLKHGYPVYLSDFSQLAKDIHFDNCNRDALIDLYYYLISSGPILPKILSKYEELKDRNKIDELNSILETLDDMYRIENFNQNDLYKIVKDLIVLIYSTNIYDTSNVDVENSVKYYFAPYDGPDIIVRFYKGLLTIMVAELLINAKREQNFIPIKRIHISLTYNHKTQYINLLIANNLSNQSLADDKKLLLLKKNNLKYNTHGLGLIKRINKIFFDKFIDIDYKYFDTFESLGFEVTIPLKTSQ